MHILTAQATSCRNGADGVTLVIERMRRRIYRWWPLNFARIYCLKRSIGPVVLFIYHFNFFIDPQHINVICLKKEKQCWKFENLQGLQITSFLKIYSA